MRKIFVLYRGLLLMFLLFGFVILVPQQSVEVFRCLLSGESKIQAAWSIIWPAALLSSLSAATALLILKDLLPGRESRVATVAAIPLLLTALGVLQAIYPSKMLRADGYTVIAGLTITAAALAFAAYRLAKIRLSPRSAQRACWSLILAMLIVLAAGLALPLAPERVVSVARAFGALALIAIFCSVLAIAMGLITSSFTQNIPVLTLLAVYAVILNFSEINNNHEIRPHQGGEKAPLSLIEAHELETWVSRRHDRQDYKDNSYPIFVVAAQGGGAYAGYHAATVLARLYDQWPQFGEHVLIVSAVSGGSVGSSLFVALLREFNTHAVTCLGQPVKMADLVDRFFADDHLSPLLLMALFPDFAQRFWPLRVNAFDRARGLEYSLEASWANLAKTCNFEHKNPFEQSLQDVNWSATAEWNTPALLLNTTNVVSGGPIVVNTVEFGGFLFKSLWRTGFESDISLSTAAVLSSRFPVVTASGWLHGVTINNYGEVAPNKLQTIYLSDGGIYENSATELATKLTYQLFYLASNIPKTKTSFYAVVIGDAGFANDEFRIQLATRLGDVRTKAATAQSISELKAAEQSRPPLFNATWLSNIDSPLGALLESREFRSKESVKMLLRMVDKNPWSPEPLDPPTPQFSVINESGLVFPLDAETPDMPLGWMLSEQTRQTLGLRAGSSSDCPVNIFPIPAAAVIQDKLVSLMVEHKDNIKGAINIYQAACSQSSILGLRPGAP